MKDDTASECIKVLDNEVDDLVKTIDMFEALAATDIETFVKKPTAEKKKRNPNCGGSVEESTDPVQEFLKMYGLLQ